MATPQALRLTRARTKARQRGRLTGDVEVEDLVEWNDLIDKAASVLVNDEYLPLRWADGFDLVD